MSEAATTEAGQTNNGDSASTQAATGDQATGQTTQQATAQTTGQAGGEQDAGQGDQAPARAAPETYEFKAPEGRELAAEVTTAFSEVARELNMPQDEAQKIIDKMAPALEARQAAALSTLVEGWTTAAKADTEFGGDKFGENLAVANQFLAEYGSKELVDLLKATGMSNNPEVIRLCVRAGRATGPDKIITGKPGGDAQVSVAQRMYPNMNP